MDIILASGSPYRAALLQRLRLPFRQLAAAVDETARADETPAQLVRRLSQAKAQSIPVAGPALVIGSDQVAELDGRALGKPGSEAAACAQLAALSGRTVRFLTGLCLWHAPKGPAQVLVEPYRVTFRQLGRDEIERYVALEQPLDCAAAIKAEGLSISLFERLSGDDPTALIGLPLIQLSNLLRAAGMAVPPP